MRSYADFLEKPKFDVRNGIKYPLPNGEATEAAILALRELATLFDLAADWRVSSELIGIRIKNTFNQQIGEMMRGVSPELMAQIEIERKERADRVSKIWREGLSHKDWLFDGYPIRSKLMLERFNALQWDKAWVDLGPSIAGNPGPYWHVPLDWDGDETVHRLYPKVIQSKWALLILHACYQSQAKVA